MKIKTQDLTGAALDWAVAKAKGIDVVISQMAKRVEFDSYVYAEYCNSYNAGQFHQFNPSHNWAQGGPIIERENIEWQWLPAPDKAHQYGARKPSLGGLNRTFCMDGPTVLIAAMRCYVASRLGDEVEVPEELLK